jgi:hypothetical protein
VKHEILPADNHYHVLDPRTNQIYKFSVPPGYDRFYLVEIRDGRGNSLALSYSLDGELETVTTASDARSPSPTATSSTSSRPACSSR